MARAGGGACLHTNVRSNGQLVISARAADRIGAARKWLEALAPGSEALVIGPSQEAADEIARAIAVKRGALFAIHRLTFNRLIGLLAAEHAARGGLAFVNVLGAQAVAARAIFRLNGDERLAYFGSVIDRPGFPKAVAAARAALSHNLIEPSQLKALDGAGTALAVVFTQFEEELRAARLIDRAGLIEAATAAIANDSGRRFMGMPTLLLDVPMETIRERDFVAAIAGAAPSIFATEPAGDSRSERLMAEALQVESITRRAIEDKALAIARLQEYLFAETAPPEMPIDHTDDTVILRSAAGEMQECVEIARRIQAEARRGVPFDRIAVLLHAPDRYAPYLEEALGRAGIPAWFARGTALPEPGGRALLALLNCTAERFSARRFAEYLSLAQVPDDAASAQIADLAATEFVPADVEFMPIEVELAADVMHANPDNSPPLTNAELSASDPLPVVEGTVRAPWRWERLLVDAAVVDGRDRWEKRLKGLEAELRLKRGDLKDDETYAAMIDRNLIDLAHLRDVAIPIIEALAAMPPAGTWADWLMHLRALIGLAIRDRAPVLAALAELEPMGPVGPIALDEVRIVLAERLGRLPAPPGRRRYGAVFVAPTNYVRGLEFDVTIVPGLAERVFPKKLIEDPLLPDALRQRLSAALPLQAERVAAERLALRLAAGAARSRTVFSYPRVDLDQARPRVPSFYALEILRAAEGRLPGFDELARRAAGERITRLGWPAPEKPEEAIDDVEFDLAVLDRLIDADPDTTIGAAHYLVDANPHLGRALRARGRRWLRRWTPSDGLVDPEPDERAALARHQLSARSYSPTALQNFSACPYRFFLQAILRLQPREEIVAIEVIDPLTRGALFHEVQFETLTALRSAGGLPVTRTNLAAAYEVLEGKLEHVAAQYHDQLAPAIERVWLDGIESIRADLREWMRRMVEDVSGFEPERFELAFGLTDRPQADPASVATAVALAEGINLRGSIDLVERDRDGNLRVTDHKTGRVRAEKNLIIGGGKTLQPVLYALAAERVLNETVTAGRLYYCTAAGGYEDRIAMLDTVARNSISVFAGVIGRALSEGFLPAAPGDGECRYCDYRRVCGPYEEMRVRLKTETAGVKARLADLTRLREMR
jgi:ATP-dependent helicase/nuclease subunit B